MDPCRQLQRGGKEPSVEATITIPLTQGMSTVVDVEDAHLADFKWCAVKIGRLWYAVRSVGPHGKQTQISMHRLIIGAIKGQKVDHKDRDGLNNRRSNLRIATTSQNNANSYRPPNRAGYRGVFAHRKRWRAKIRCNGKPLHLGFFATKIEAAKAYDSAAREIHGDFAVLNFPEE